MSRWKRLSLIVFGLSLLVLMATLGWRLVSRDRAPEEPPVAVVVEPEQSPVPEDTPSALTPVQTPTTEKTPRTFHLPFVRSAEPTAEPTPTLTPTPEPTPLPLPTPTPTLPWPAPLTEPGQSKLGLHVQWNNSPEIMEFVRRMLPPVIKTLDDLGFVAEIKEASPETVVVSRLTHPQPMDGDPEAMARDFVARNLPTYLMHPGVDYWEGYNEPDIRGRMDWYARFEAERVRAMAEHGLRTAIGAFSTGVPEWEDFEAFLPAVEAAKQHGGILTVHEYDAPYMDRSKGAGLPGHPNHPHRGALTLRYRWWYEDFLIPRNLVIPLVISEAGVDGLVTNRPGPEDAAGWLDFARYWKEDGAGRDPLEVYLPQLDWYDRQVQQDDYVIGWTVFTVGSMNPDWESYDVTDYLRHIAKRIVVPNAR